MAGVTLVDVRGALDSLWRVESAKVLARVVRIVRDLDRAEELTQDAWLTALEHWQRTGPPPNPAAWLMQTAKNRAIDDVRRRRMLDRKHETLVHEPKDEPPERDLDDNVGDDLLRLVLVACHPVLQPDARVALTLRLIAGLTVDEVARAFLTTPTAIQQRIVRAKRALADAAVSFETPRGPELSARLTSVLEVIYLVFNEGYAATAGDDWVRPQLCRDARRLARVLVGLVPDDPEVHALASLLDVQSSRLDTRADDDGNPVLLLDQDRSRWNQRLISRGLDELAQAQDLADTRGPYLLQASIAACHAQAPTAASTSWETIAALYDELAALADAPVVELNRAVAHGMAFGPAAGLALLDVLNDDPSLQGYHLLPAVRGDLLTKLGRHDEAAVAWDTAAALTDNERERALLRARAAASRAN